MAILITTAAFVSITPIHLEADAESETCLRIGFLDRIDSLNPNVGLTPASRLFCSLVYDCLQGVGEDLEAVPNLALEWNVVEEFEPYGSVWDFNLTENAYWHDGVPFEADDAAYTVNLIADNLLQMREYSPYAYYIDHAEAMDDHTLRVHFYDRITEEPIPVAYTDSLSIPILPKHIIEGWTVGEIGFNWIGATEEQTPPTVGTGPFMVTDAVIDEFVAGEKITLVRNPEYHGIDDAELDARLDRIEMRFFDNETLLAEALENGDVDVTELSRDTYLDLRERVETGELQGISTFDGLSPNQQFTYICLNIGSFIHNPSINDPIVRQALAHATDKEYIVDKHYLGLAEVANTLVPSLNDFWHYELPAEDLYEHDLDLAAQMLEDAGYRHVSSSTVREATADSYAVLAGLVTEGTKLKYNMAIRQEYPEERQIALYIQEKWREIGIEIEYNIMTEAAMSSWPLLPNDNDLWITSGQSDADPHRILFTQSQWSIGLCSWWTNHYIAQDYEENFSHSIQSLDRDQRRTHVLNCQRIQYEDVGYIMLGELRQTYAWRTDNLTGWGDWEAHPGRSIDAMWTGNPLYFDLEPTNGDQTVVVLAAAAMLLAATAAVTVILVRHRRKA